MIITKRQLIQEGVLDFVKNNYGKGLLGAGGILAAKAGVFGEGAKATVDKGLKNSSEWLSQANDKIAKEYGTPAQKAVATAKDNLDKAEDKLDNAHMNYDKSDNNVFQTNTIDTAKSDFDNKVDASFKSDDSNLLNKAITIHNGSSEG